MNALQVSMDVSLVAIMSQLVFRTVLESQSNVKKSVHVMNNAMKDVRVNIVQNIVDLAKK